MNRRKPHGFTLVETLVVMAITGLLLALAVPAVQSVRENSRRLRCHANLAQMGLAAANYHDSHGCYPMGDGHIPFRDIDGKCAKMEWFGPFVAVLPYLGESARYDSFNHNQYPGWAEHVTVGAAALPAFSCPSESSALVAPGDGPNPFLLGRTSYAWSHGSAGLDYGTLEAADANCGLTPVTRERMNGMFNSLAPLRAKDAADGLSATMFASEHAFSSAEELHESAYPFGYPAHNGVWWLGGSGCSLFTARSAPLPVEAFRIDDPEEATRRWAALSVAATSCHPAGVGTLLGDGAVRTISYAVESSAANDFQLLIGPLPEPGVWQRLATRANGDGPTGEF